VQQLSNLAPFVSQLSADVRIFGAGLPERDWQGHHSFPDYV